MKKIDIEELIPNNFSFNGYALFRGCKGINTIDFIDFNTSIIYNMSYMFYDCISLTQIKNLSPVNSQDMSYLFYNCYNLNLVNFIFPENMTSNKVTNMESMFKECNTLFGIFLDMNFLYLLLKFFKNIL